MGGAQNYFQNTFGQPPQGPSPQGMNAGGVNFGGMQTTQPRTGGSPMPNPGTGIDLGGGGMAYGMGLAGGNAPGGRIESVFGPTGIQATPLQRQASGGISQFLNQPSPETRALNRLTPGLEGLFGQRLGTPGSIAGNLGTFGGADNPMLGQLGQFQNALSGQLQGQSPLPQNAQQTLNQGLSTDLLGGGLRESLQGLLAGQGGGASFQGMFQGGPQQADLSAIQRELGFNPNQQLLDALQPRFEQNLALANQAGGRFGSANAIQRSQAVNDYNLMASQALQQDLQRRAGLASSLANASVGNASQANQARLGFGGLNQQGQLGAANALLQGAQGSAGLQQNAANTLGQFGQAGMQNQQQVAQLLGQLGLGTQGNQLQANQLLGNLGLGYDQLNQSGQLGAGQLLGQLAGQAGQNDFNRLLGAFGVGTQQAQQNDVQTQRNLAILLQQLGALQGATLGAPVQTTPSGNQQALGFLGAGLGALGSIFGG